MATKDLEVKIKCHGIIHVASTAAGAVGAGVAQIPCSDSAVIIPIQIAMIMSLGKVFGIELTESAAQSALSEGMATYAGRALSQMLIGWLPGVGNVVNAGTAAAITEALGWLIVQDFEKKSAGRTTAVGGDAGLYEWEEV